MRKVVFWLHLLVGISAGIVIFMMSATGVLLTYERQILEWVESQYSIADLGDSKRLSTDEVLTIARDLHPDEHHFFIRWVNRKGSAIPVWAGNKSYLLDPNSGEVVRYGQGATSEFFQSVTGLHRWLALQGNSRVIGKNITAYSNLLFLFLILSGFYLWFPPRFKWSLLKQHISFRAKHKSAHARYFNWHHVFGFWAILPLFIIVSSATIFHFKWANVALYAAFDEDLPQREEHPELTRLVDGEQSYESLFNIAKQHAIENGAADWHSIWVELGEVVGEVRFFIDRSIGHHPEHAYSLYLNKDTGDVIRVKKQADWSRGDQAWDIVRYLHTGELFGFVGQTIAGLASFAACILVYTGMLLGWRRLVVSNR